MVILLLQKFIHLELIKLAENDTYFLRVDMLGLKASIYYGNDGISFKKKLTMLYRLGVIDHLKKIDSLKDNDSIMSRVLTSFL